VITHALGLSGTALAADAVGATRDRPQVWGAEPAAVDDAARSLASGVRQPSSGGPTMADGLVATLSDRTFRILQRAVDEIVVVTEDEIAAAMRLLFEEAKLVVEPSGAVGLAGVLARREVLPKDVGVIVSGGNVDLHRLPFEPAPG
jgi:threonine dehydratase